MNKLIVRGDPIHHMQHIYIYTGGEKVDNLGVHLDEVPEVVLFAVEKYNIEKINLSGSRFYMEGIEQQIRKYAAENGKYSNLTLTFCYV